MTCIAPTGAEGFIAGCPSTVTSPAAMSFAACVRERAWPREAKAESSRSGRSVSAFEPLPQLIVQVRKRFSPRLERLILDHAKAREQSIRFCIYGRASFCIYGRAGFCIHGCAGFWVHWRALHASKYSAHEYSSGGTSSA